LTAGNEYFPVGNDDIRSALSSYIHKPLREPGSSGGRIKLADLSHSELSSLAFLFGGVGDGKHVADTAWFLFTYDAGRHVYATLIDLGFQTRETALPKRSSLSVHITLLDILPTVLARDLTILFALDQYNSLGTEATGVKGEEIMALISYVFLVSLFVIVLILPIYNDPYMMPRSKGVVMPSYTYDRYI
jgi:hypothetical protein